MTDVAAVPSLDLDRYLGCWYEICRLPLKWEDETATDITANYSLADDGKVRVDNRCFDAEGKPTQAVGEATPVDEANSRLKVTFLPRGLRWLPFTEGDYWVLKIDPDYQTSLVGTPDRKNLWVLSREPSLADEMLQDYLAEARRQGFDLAELITPRHTGREVTDSMVEEE
ncbi:lipocalin family protein [Mesorhizobium sp. 1B3]|uniref:lipocalin family protein n=1 Tax=Mesorhizobium sp. 1B3 TaxID=3243599 RepID=UPI003D99C23D